MTAVDALLGITTREKIWEVNTEQEYSEERNSREV